MKTPAPIHIFRPGTQTDVSGTTLAFIEAMLEASAKAYDPAPTLVMDHSLGLSGSKKPGRAETLSPC